MGSRPTPPLSPRRRDSFGRALDATGRTSQAIVSILSRESRLRRDFDLPPPSARCNGGAPTAGVAEKHQRCSKETIIAQVKLGCGSVSGACVSVFLAWSGLWDWGSLGCQVLAMCAGTSVRGGRKNFLKEGTMLKTKWNIVLALPVCALLLLTTVSAKEQVTRRLKIQAQDTTNFATGVDENWGVCRYGGSFTNTGQVVVPGQVAGCLAVATGSKIY